MSTVLLRRPTPLPHESLSSYTYRLAIANECKTQWVLELFRLKRKEIGYLDDLNNDKIISSISKELSCRRKVLLI
ncbi:hypothetical protein [Desulfosporosinus sp. SB140]|uniref:hypothetical protein n=1 Tax=Desulfosporosinus paludis TaxID=3115649 RepID=UPI00388FA9B6